MLENGAEPELISRLTGLGPDIIKSAETSGSNKNNWNISPSTWQINRYFPAGTAHKQRLIYTGK